MEDWESESGEWDWDSERVRGVTVGVFVVAILIYLAISAAHPGPYVTGPGGTPQFTKEYRAFLAAFLRENNVKTVVDGPCGHWTFSQLVDWGPVRAYLGIDARSLPVRQNRRFLRSGRFHAGPRLFRFRRQGITSTRLPPADLFLNKDHLMFLTFREIHLFLRRLLPRKRRCKYKFALITSDMRPGVPNADLALDSRQRRSLDIRRAPFSLPGRLVFVFPPAAGPLPKRTLLLNFTEPEWGCGRLLSSGMAPASLFHLPSRPNETQPVQLWY